MDTKVPGHNGGFGDYAFIRQGEAGEVVLIIVRPLGCVRPGPVRYLASGTSSKEASGGASGDNPPVGSGLMFGGFPGKAVRRMMRLDTGCCWVSFDVSGVRAFGIQRKWAGYYGRGFVPKGVEFRSVEVRNGGGKIAETFRPTIESLATLHRWNPLATGDC